MNAVSGKNLTVVFSSMKSMREWATTSTLHSTVSWTKRGSAGRQRHACGACATPYQVNLGAVFGGWQRGSLTPQITGPPLPTDALTATRAAQKAARCTAEKPLTRKDIDQSNLQPTTFAPPQSR